MKKIYLQCHDCGEETIILDEYEDKESSDFLYCPYCGSDNIEVV